MQIRTLEKVGDRGFVLPAALSLSASEAGGYGREVEALLVAAECLRAEVRHGR
jgi:hypothetical protein